MANRDSILDKINRNMGQRGVVVARVGDTVEVTKTGGDILTVSYVDKDLQNPIGGVDGNVSPFLGIGIAAPGSIQIKGEAGETTIALIFDTVEALQLMAEVAGYANDVVIQHGDSTVELARIEGHEHLLGLGM